MTDKPAPGSRTRRILRNSSVIALLALAAFFARGLFLRQPPAQKLDAGVDDRNISYLAFNEENKKSLEIKCQASQAQGVDELHLKGISAVIFKSGRMNQDIRFFADSGIAKDDFNHFQIQGNARIVSEGLTVQADRFLMTHKKNLLAAGSTRFSGKNISGTAAAGIEFLFELNEYKFFDVQGAVAKNDRKFDLATRMVWMFKEMERLELKGASSIRTADSLLSGEQIVMRFSNGFSDLQSYVSLGNSRLLSEKTIPGAAAERREVLEITANAIESILDAEGNLERLLIFDQGQLAVAGDANRCEIRGDNIDCYFFPSTQNVREIFVRTPGEIQSRGSQNMDFAAEQIAIQYGETGDMQRASAERNVRFTSGDFSGTAPELQLDARQQRLVIAGENAEIKSRGKRFAGPRFVIDTRTNQLTAPAGVQATVLLDKGSVLLRPSPIYLVAGSLAAGGDGQNTAFREKIQLFQDETKLTAGEIHFKKDKEQIVAQGQARLQFANEKETIVLQGGVLTFDSGRRRITAQGEALLLRKQNTLQAGRITLFFSPDDQLQTVAAQNGVRFANDKISGQAKLLNWEFAKNILLFKDEAQISRKNSGTTRGQELRFNLESSEIVVTGADDRSETTLRPDRP
ncbi:MAG: hypothetical protein MUF02_02455 [Acidobacteria bacterium]|nr:hypothetical protein [Acidobacteriota bacterium]